MTSILQTWACPVEQEDADCDGDRFHGGRRDSHTRQPGPDDPVFFDPDADTPQPLDLERYEKDLADAMAAAGIDPRLIYASRKTGLLVTEENLDKLPEEALEEWNAALEEYDELTKGEPS